MMTIWAWGQADPVDWTAHDDYLVGMALPAAIRRQAEGEYRRERALLRPPTGVFRDQVTLNGMIGFYQPKFHQEE